MTVRTSWLMIGKRRLMKPNTMLNKPADARDVVWGSFSTESPRPRENLLSPLDAARDRGI